MKLKSDYVYVPNPIFLNNNNLQYNLSDHFDVYAKTKTPCTVLFQDITNKIIEIKHKQTIQHQNQNFYKDKPVTKKKYSPRKIKKRAIFQFQQEEDSIINQQETETEKDLKQQNIPLQANQIQNQQEGQCVQTDNQYSKITKRFNFLHNQLNFSSSDCQENAEKIQSQEVQKQLNFIFPKLKAKVLAGFTDNQEEQNKTKENEKNKEYNQQNQNMSVDSNKNSQNDSTQSQQQQLASRKHITKSVKSIKNTAYINTTQFIRQFVQNEKQYLKIPLPPNKSIQLVLKRDKSKSKSQYVQYHIYDAKNFKHLITIKKSQNYQIFAKSNVENAKAHPHQHYHTATLITNFFGNTFNLYYPPKNSGLKNQQISATITYDTNILGFNGPRKMNIYLTRENLILGSQNLEDVYNKNQQKYCIQKYVNKPAKWNKNVKSYVLNLKGRAKLSSVKNFVIVKDDQKELQPQSEAQQMEQKSFAIFGKIGKDTFNLVISSPFSILQGIAIGLSTFQRKVTCQ